MLQQFQTDFPRLGPATQAAALASTLSFDGPQVLSTDFLIPLEGTQGPTVFQGVDVNTSFTVTLLNPSFLYSVQDLKFFSSTPPLRRTALPAKLADLTDGTNPVGDYHAIRLP